MKIQNHSPVGAARELHHHLGWTCPSDFTLEEIANALGIIIKEVPIKGSEGRILIKGNTGIISLNSEIMNPGKRNFVIAHEIGHFVLHKSLTILFSDTHKTLSDWHAKGLHEQQANDFASELLMPEDLFKHQIKEKKFEISLIKRTSTYFNVSLLAALMRCVILEISPVMIVFMEDGMVKWKRCSADFPFQYLTTNSTVPAYTEAGDYFNRKRLGEQPEKVDAIEWFPNDFKLKYNTDWKLWEQCYQVSDNGLVSCLWT